MSGLSCYHCPVLPLSQANPGKGYLTISSSQHLLELAYTDLQWLIVKSSRLLRAS